MSRWPALLAVCLLALAAGCGGSESGSSATKVDLALDFTPNAVHAPILVAEDTGLDAREGVDLKVRPPGSGPDALRLVTGGRALVGVLDINDLAVARESGADVVAIGALVQRPLAALLATPGVRRPRDLAGRTVGVSGLPSDPAFLRAIVEQDGGDYDAIRQVTIGFQAVPALVGGRVDAVPAFWNAEGVALRRRGVALREFRVERYGAPAYPEVVLVTTRDALRSRAGDLRAVLRALAGGVRAVQADPEAAVALVARRSSADRRLVRAQLDAVAPLFSPPLRLDRRTVDGWAAFAARIGLVERRPDVARAFAFDLAP